MRLLQSSIRLRITAFASEMGHELLRRCALLGRDAGRLHHR